MLEFLGEKICSGLKKIDDKFLYEIHIRINRPVVLNYKNNFCYLSTNGATKNKEKGIVVDKIMLEKIILSASNNSLYSYEDEIRQGFITLKNGIRIGICGRFIYSGKEIRNISEISSLSIRIPHSVSGCSNEILPYIFSNNSALNTLIVSPPACGKTTLLRDIVQNINKFTMENICVIDERNEIFTYSSNKFSYKIPDNVDVLTNSLKKDAFNIAIRSMSPHCIITDEIDINGDIDSITKAITCGCKIICSIHAKDLMEIKRKIKVINVDLISIFDRIVIISSRLGKGTIECVYDNKENIIYRNNQ